MSKQMEFILDEMKLFKAYTNSGDWGGWRDELVVAKDKEDAIRIMKEKYPYKIGSHDFGASEFKVEGYELTLTPKENFV